MHLCIEIMLHFKISELIDNSKFLRFCSLIGIELITVYSETVPLGNSVNHNTTILARLQNGELNNQLRILKRNILF